MSLAAIAERLRHSSALTTQRYAKHVRYAAEVERMPSRVLAYGNWVDEKLGAILRGALVPPAFDSFVVPKGGPTLRR